MQPLPQLHSVSLFVDIPILYHLQAEIVTVFLGNMTIALSPHLVGSYNKLSDNN